jgi:hypothetical protein
MTGFINLMGSDVWSEADIKSRLHSEIRAEVTEFAETELNRALQGAALGMHTLSQQEQVSLMHFKAVTDRVAALGVTARADAALLRGAMAVEAALQLQARPDASPEQLAAAAAVIAAATTPVNDLVALRNPAPATLEA